MNFRLHRLALETAITALLASAAAQAQAAGFEIFAPHRAVYDMKLKQASDRSGIESMDGRIVYEVTGNECDGLSVRYRFVSSIATSSESYRTDQQTITYETADGREFSFVTKSLVDDRVDSIVRGKAARDGNGVAVDLAEPKNRHLDLPPAVFISTHLLEVIEAAQKGETIFKRNVFDGSDAADEVVSSSAFIGPAKVVAAPFAGEAPEAIAAVANQQAWPVTVSYFSLATGSSAESLPLYEASFLLYPNGVSRKLVMRYPDYSLTGELSSLELLKREPCKAN